MSEDPRCCGNGTCIIDAEGGCWCGHQWNYENCEKLSLPACGSLSEAAAPEQKDED